MDLQEKPHNADQMAKAKEMGDYFAKEVINNLDHEYRLKALNQAAATMTAHYQLAIENATKDLESTKMDFEKFNQGGQR